MRIIDADKLLSDVSESLYHNNHTGEGRVYHRQEHAHFAHMIEMQPTIEAIPLEKWNRLEDIVVEMAESDESATWHEACNYILHCMSEIKREEL